MFRTLYARLMTMYTAVLLIAMLLMSLLMYERIRTDRIGARLDALTAEAYDVAYLVSQRNAFISTETDRYLMWKSTEIMQEYDAFLLVIDRYGKVMSIGDQTMEISSNYTSFTEEELLSFIMQLVEGHEIKVRSIQRETGKPMFTVGAPFVQNGQVLGAVFILTSAQNVEASYQDILGQVLRATLISMVIGAVLLLFVCRVITNPLRAMAGAADRFARGDFEMRVPVKSRDEVGRLAESFNSMARELEQLENTRREFVANVSHELRSPLTSMQGFVGGMLDGTIPDSERDHYLEIVSSETKRLSKLIAALLDLSHIESGQTPLAKSRFDINEMTARALLRQEGRILEKEIDVDVRFDGETCFVHADPDRIEQVLVNLLDNAVKYTNIGGKITVVTKREKDTVSVSVADDGPGISEGDLPRIFDRFFMADRAHTPGGGTGIGLAIAKRIIDQHGQRITVRSTPLAETRFEFTLEGA